MPPIEPCDLGARKSLAARACPLVNVRQRRGLRAATQAHNLLPVQRREGRGAKLCHKGQPPHS
jgi:hypothetical protein